MRIKHATAALLPIAFSTTCLLSQGQHQRAVPRIDHAFVILMENRQFTQIIGNANAPFINSYAKSANLATNYYAVGHPSLTNYLEIVGGSNFGIENDDAPDWHNNTCVPNIQSGMVADESATTNTCPIAVRVGMRRLRPLTLRMRARRRSRFTTSRCRLPLRAASALPIS